MSQNQATPDPFKERVYISIALTKDLNDLLTMAGLTDFTFFNSIIIDTILKNEASFNKQLSWELENGLIDQSNYDEKLKWFQKLKTQGDL